MKQINTLRLPSVGNRPECWNAARCCSREPRMLKNMTVTNHTLPKWIVTRYMYVTPPPNATIHSPNIASVTRYNSTASKSYFQRMIPSVVNPECSMSFHVKFLGWTFHNLRIHRKMRLLFKTV